MSVKTISLQKHKIKMALENVIPPDASPDAVIVALAELQIEWAKLLPAGQAEEEGSFGPDEVEAWRKARRVVRR